VALSTRLFCFSNSTQTQVGCKPKQLPMSSLEMARLEPLHPTQASALHYPYPALSVLCQALLGIPDKASRDAKHIPAIGLTIKGLVKPAKSQTTMKAPNASLSGSDSDRVVQSPR
jgi:hypothetical protein